MADPILSVEKFSLVMADGVTSVTANLSAADITELTPRVSCRNTDTTEVGWDDLLVDVEFLTGPNRVQLTRSGSDGEIQAEVVVERWDTAEVSLQTASFSMTGTTLDVTVTALDLAKSFVTFAYEGTLTSDIDDHFVRAMLSTTTNLHLERDNSGGTMAGHWWSVEDTGSNFDVERVQGLTTAGDTADATITTVALDRTMVLCSQEETTAGEAPRRVGMGFLLVATTFRFSRGGTAGSVFVDAFIVQFTVASGVTVLRGTVTMGVGVDTGTENHTAVADLAKSFVHCPMALNGCHTDDASFRQSAFAKIKQNSTTQVQADGKDGDGIELVAWEIIEFGVVAAALNQQATFFGANF